MKSGSWITNFENGIYTKKQLLFGISIA